MSWSLVQANAAANSGGITNSFGCTFASSNTAGNLLVCAVGSYYASSGCSDPTNGTYTLAQTANNGNNTVQLYYKVATYSSSPVTVTLTSTGIYPSVVIAEFSGGGGTIAADGTGAGQSFASATAYSSGNLTFIGLSDLILGAASWQNSNSVTVGGSFASVGFEPGSNGHANGISLTYLLNTSSSPQNPSWTLGSSAAGAAIGFAWSIPVLASLPQFPIQQKTREAFWG